MTGIRERSRYLILAVLATIAVVLVGMVLVCYQQVAPKYHRVGVIGDSYSARLSPDIRPYWEILGEQLSWSVKTFAVPGTGYVNATNRGRPYEAQQLEGIVSFSPDLVIVEGSRNDAGAPRATLTDSATSLYQHLSQRLPGATVVVLGPMTPLNESSPAQQIEFERLRDIVRDAAAESRLPFIDPLGERWLDIRPGLVGPDHIHPSAEGQAEISSRFRSALIAHHLL